MLIDFALIIFFSLLFFFKRYFIRLKNRYDYGTDLFFHFYNIQQIKENSYKALNDIERAKFSVVNSYPYFFHYLMSLLPSKMIKKVELILSPLLDSISYVLISLLFFHLLNPLSIDFKNIYKITFLTLFLFSPVLNEYSGIFRNYHGNPRIFSQFLFFLFLLIYILNLNDSSLSIFFILSVLLVALISITSKFTNQVLFFLIIGLLIFKEFQLSFLIILGYVFSWIVFNKSLPKIIIGQINHSIFYYKVFRHQINDYKKSSEKINNYFFHFLKIIKQNNLLKRILLYHPFIIPIFFYLFENSYEIQQFLGKYYVLIKIYIILYFCSLLTYFPKFSFLGEYYRYLEYFIFFELLIFSILSINFNPYLFFSISIFYIFFGLKINYNALKKDSNKILTQKYSEISRGLKPIDKSDNLIYCLSNFFWLVLYFSKKIKIPFYAVNCDLKTFGENRFLDLYGRKILKPTKKFKYLKEKYKITHIISSNEDLENNLDLFENDCKLKILYKGKFITILKI